MAKPKLHKADSLCKCGKLVMSYMRHGAMFYHPRCVDCQRKYKSELKKKYKELKKVEKARLTNGEIELENKAREWNKAHPFHPATLLAFVRGLRNMSRIPSGGKVNHANIE